MFSRPATTPRRAWRLGRWAIALLVINEVRGVLVVAVTWHAWWPLVVAAWRLGSAGR